MSADNAAVSQVVADLADVNPQDAIRRVVEISGLSGHLHFLN